MIMRLWPFRASLVLAAAACLLLLLAAGAHLFAMQATGASGSTIIIPVWPTRVLMVNIWLRDSVATFWPDGPGFANHNAERVIKEPGSVSIALWYQDRATVTTTRLAIFKVPVWPLLLLATVLAAGAFRMWPMRSTRGLFVATVKGVGAESRPKG